MFAIHTLEHRVASRLKGEVQIRTHMLEFKVCIENISGHIMWIRTRESDPIESIYGIDLFEKFTEWGLQAS